MKVLFVLFIVTSLFTQNYSYQSFYSNNFILADNLGMGNTGISQRNKLSGALLNPATIDFKGVQSFVGYSHKTSTKIDSIGYTFSSADSEPLSAGIGFNPFDGVSLGFIYNLDSSEKIDFGKLRYNFRDATLESQSRSYSLNFPLKVKLSESLSFGTLIKVNEYEFFETAYVHHLNRIEVIKSKIIEKSHTSGIFGLFYEIDNTFAVGAKYSFGENISFTHKNLFGNTEETLNFEIPGQLGIGLSYLSDQIRFNADLLIDYYDYEGIYFDESQMNLSLGASYDFEDYTIKSGFFTVGDVRNQQAILLEEIKDFSQYFFTIGAEYPTPYFSLSASIATSSIFSSENVSHTILNIGISQNL